MYDEGPVATDARCSQMHNSEDISPARILHVDDDPQFGGVVKSFLEKENDAFTVIPEDSAAAGLDRLARGEFDCVISDYRMPGVDGLEFLEAVREEWPDLPFFLFTGEGGEGVADRAISMGVTDYLQKEIGTDQYAVLANRVATAVAKRRAERDAKRGYQAIEAAREGISLLDSDGRFLYVNRTYADTYGYDPPELLGNRWSALYTDGVSDDVISAVRNTGSWSGQARGITKTGRSVVKDLSMNALEDGGFVCTVRDIIPGDDRDGGITATLSTDHE